MAEELHNSLDGQEPASADVRLSVLEGHAFETAVAEGKFATFADAVNASAKKLGLNWWATDSIRVRLSWRCKEE